MNLIPVELLDANKNTVVLLSNVEFLNHRYHADMIYGDISVELVELFDWFEEMVNGQMFSFLDETEDKLRVACPFAKMNNGEIIDIFFLQPVPSDKIISFQVVDEPLIYLKGKHVES